MPDWQSWRFKSLICGARAWALMKCHGNCTTTLPIAKRSPPGFRRRYKNWSSHNCVVHNILIWGKGWSVDWPHDNAFAWVVCWLTTLIVQSHRRSVDWPPRSGAFPTDDRFSRIKKPFDRGQKNKALFTAAMLRVRSQQTGIEPIDIVLQTILWIIAVCAFTFTDISVRLRNNHIIISKPIRIPAKVQNFIQFRENWSGFLLKTRQ